MVELRKQSQNELFKSDTSVASIYKHNSAYNSPLTQIKLNYQTINLKIKNQIEKRTSRPSTQC